MAHEIQFDEHRNIFPHSAKYNLLYKCYWHIVAPK